MGEMNLPWRKNQYGTVIDSTGRDVVISGFSLALGSGEPRDGAEARTDAILRAVNRDALFNEAVEALAPFAEVNITRATEWAEQNEPWPDDRRLFGFDGFWMTVGMVRRARAVLAKAREASK